MRRIVLESVCELQTFKYCMIIAAGFLVIAFGSPTAFSQPYLDISDVVASEGDSGTTDFVFTVTLSAPSSETVTVEYYTRVDIVTVPATSSDDFVDTSGTLTFSPGATSQTILVQVNGDTEIENDEYFAVWLENPVNAQISFVLDGIGLGTIENDDLPAISISDVSGQEGDSGINNFDFIVTLSEPSIETVTVEYKTLDGGDSANAPEDYAAANGLLTFLPGTTAQSINVQVNGDTEFEEDEYFAVWLENPANAEFLSMFDQFGTGTIENDDDALEPALRISDVTVTEGDDGVTNCGFVVTLSTPTDETVTVEYRTDNDSATSPDDYAAESGILTFDPGTTTQTITIEIYGDTEAEDDEIFTIILENSSGAAIADDMAVGIIQNDDAPELPVLSISDVSATEGDNGKKNFNFQVTLSKPSNRTVSVGYYTRDGTAISPDDYLAMSWNLTFNPSTSTRTITVQVNGDTEVEGDETFDVILHSPVNATISDNTAIGTIRNDDTANPPGPPSLNVIYVDSDAPGGNDGSSWTDAYRFLQDALAKAAAGYEIQVAQGTYSPDEDTSRPYGSGERTATFQLVNGVTIKGGYAGFGEPDPDAREFEAYETILSGNLNGGHSYHVVTGSGTDATAILDGFTIEGGNAGSEDGGGMYNVHGSPMVINCLFTGNLADDGGGICNDYSNPTLVNCVFRDNHADWFGGGMYNCDNSSPFLDNCVFSNNQADWFGGGVFNSDGYLNMTNCWLDNNSAFAVAGLANYESSVLMATSCRFTANVSYADGGALGNLSSDAVIINCIFVRNDASFTGGAVYNVDGAATLTNCTVVENAAGRDAGGVMNDSANYVSNITLSNCILWGNTASGRTGSTAQISASPDVASINYCCIQDLPYYLRGSNNIASDPMFVRNPGGSNGSHSDREDRFGDLRLSRTSPCLDAGRNDADTDAYTPGLQPLPATDFAGNPRFVGIVDMGALEGAADAILVSSNPVTVPENGSAAFTVALSTEFSEPVTVVVSLESGDQDISIAYGSVLNFNPSNFSVPQTVGLTAADDLDFEDGSATILLDAGDIGRQFVTVIEDDDDTYEPPKPPPSTSDVIYVDGEASGKNNGSSWTDAYKYLSDALAYVRSGVEVRVADGVYRPDEDTGHPNGTGDRQATFQLKSGVSLKGGYAGFGEPNPDERDVEAYETILSGDLDENDGPDFENNNENTHHVVTGSGTDATAVLDGFTIKAGNAGTDDGGGLYNNNGSPTVMNCLFVTNHADDGGGMCNYSNSNPTLYNCVFQNNRAEWYGGGMYNDNSSPSTDNCLFRCNRADLFGGGIFNSYSYLNMNECWFDENVSFAVGGVVNYESSELVATSCTFTANVSSADAGALGNLGSNATITNCIFAGNNAPFSGGAVYNVAGSANLTNCTILANTAGRDGAGITNDSSNYESKLSLANCILWGNMVAGKTGISVQISTNPNDSDINYCCIQDLPDDFEGAGNFDADPNLTPDGHLRVGSFSPCIGTGTPMNAPQTDRDGDPRLPASPRLAARGVDVGSDQFFDTDGDRLPDYWEQKYFGDTRRADPDNDADGDRISNLEEYELYGSDPVRLPLHVDAGNVDDPAQDGTSDHPFATIQAAIDAADNGDTVLAAAGTYMGPGNRDIDFDGKSVVLYAPDGPDAAIIDCEQAGRGFNFHSGEGPGTALVGLTITNGTAGYGGAIRCDNSHPQIRNCVLVNNSAYYGAGGIDCDLSIPVLADCIISNNIPAAIDMEYGGARITGDLHVDSDCVGNGLALTSHATLHMDSGVILHMNNSSISCNISGPGTIKVDPGSELIIKSDAIVDLRDETNPDLNGRILCDGLLQLRDNASLLYAYVDVSRTDFGDNTIIANCVINAEAGAPYGQFFIEDDVELWLNEITADGDRYLDLNPEDCNLSNIHVGIIDVNITEGVGGEYGGLFELRGAPKYDLINTSSCDPDNEFFCQVDGIQNFDTNTWTINQLELVEGAKLNLTNRFDFQYPYDTGGDDEVLYVKHLILGPDSVLNTAFNRLYYENLVMDPTAQVVNVPLLGFSLKNISFDNENDFITRVKHNNFEDPKNPGYDRIHVERITGYDPDPDGIMRMCNLKEKDPNSPYYGQLINARAKGLFAKANEDQIFIMFEYLFETSEPGTELVIYLSDIPQFGDPNGTSYIEVAHLPAPPPSRPGSAGSGRFGVFKRKVAAGNLNFVRGVRIELELIGPEGACVLINNWDPEVNCFGICMDFDGFGLVDTADFMVVIREYGLCDDGAGLVCLNSGFSDDGYVDLYDVSGWDWTLNLDSRLNFCGENIPLSDEAALLSAGRSSGTRVPGLATPATSREARAASDGLSSNPRGLLIMGKRGRGAHDVLTTKLEDRLYILDDQGQYSDEFVLAANRGNTKLVLDPGGELYQLSYEKGLIKIVAGESVLPSGRLPYAVEPRYQMAATVSVGLQGDEQNVWGRPVMDAAFGADGYLYVVPVVVQPAGEEAYLAAAKLRLRDNQTPPYDIIRLYDDPPLPGDNQQRNSLREIEVDNRGNVYVTNAHRLNESDILWAFDSSTGLMKDRLDLVAPYSDVNIPAPIGLCASEFDSLLYLASTRNRPDAGSAIVYGLSTDTLRLERIIAIEGMGHITSVTENPDTGSLWVAGFTMSDIPDYPNPFKPSFYRPYLAEIPYGSNGPVEAKSLSAASDLALPMSILWAGSPTEGFVVGSNIKRNSNGGVDMVTLSGLAQSWLEPQI